MQFEGLDLFESLKQYHFLDIDLDILKRLDVKNSLENLLSSNNKYNYKYSRSKILITDCSQKKLQDIIEHNNYFKIIYLNDQIISASIINSFLDDGVDISDTLILVDSQIDVRSLLNGIEREVEKKNALNFEKDRQIELSIKHRNTFYFDVLWNDILKVDDIIISEVILKYLKNNDDLFIVQEFPVNYFARYNYIYPVYLEQVCFYLISNKNCNQIWFDLILFKQEFEIFKNEKSKLKNIEAFEKKNEAICIVDKKYNIISANDRFFLLNITTEQLSTLEMNAKVELNNILYSVDSSNFDDKTKMIIFYKVIDIKDTNKFKMNAYCNAKNSKDSFDIKQMAIITSSLAHELRNPLAGISAALDLLLDEDNLDQESSSLLMEMKNDNKRCQKIINLFLGFSKENSKKVSDVRIAGQEALQLLKVRLLELNYQIELEFSGTELFYVNQVAFTMFFYVLFNELITSLSHNEILLNHNFEKDKYKKIKILFRFDSSSVNIEFCNFDKIYNMIQKSSLINFVAKYEGCNINVIDNVLFLGRK